MWRFIPLFSVGVGALFVALGCRSTDVRVVSDTYRNLKAIDAAYKKVIESSGLPPANLQELLPALKELEGEAEQILRSPDDGQEYVILWGTDPYANPALVLAYEKTGKGGRRQVLWGGKVWSMSAEELQKAPFPPGHKAPS